MSVVIEKASELEQYAHAIEELGQRLGLEY